MYITSILLFDPHGVIELLKIAQSIQLCKTLVLENILPTL